MLYQRMLHQQKFTSDVPLAVAAILWDAYRFRKQLCILHGNAFYQNCGRAVPELKDTTQGTLSFATNTFAPYVLRGWTWSGRHFRDKQVFPHRVLLIQDVSGNILYAHKNYKKPTQVTFYRNYANGGFFVLCDNAPSWEYFADEETPRAICRALGWTITKDGG